MINVQVTGNLVRDSELRFTADGKPVLSFSVASDLGFGENKSTVYPRFSLWGARGSSLEPWLKKGTKVFVQGIVLKNDIWESNGKSGVNLDISVHEIELMGGSRSAQESKAGTEGGFREKKPAQTAAGAGEAVFEDDPMPF